jgi:hypothetical protein
MDFISGDRTLKVGDLVFSAYHKGELIFKITHLQRRFLYKSDLQYSIYEKGKVGDEYDSLATIESVANLSIFTDSTKKFRKTVRVLDASFLRRVDPAKIVEHTKRINDLISELWP